MGNLTSTLTVSLRDDVSGKAKKVAQALKSATDQVTKLGKAGVSDRLGQQVAKLGLSAKEIEKVSAAWKTYAASQGLAAKSSDWTRAQASQVRAWENATIGALRRVQREHRNLQAAAARPNRLAGAITGAATMVSGYRAKEFGKKAVISAAEFDIGVRKQREFVDIPKDLQERLLVPQAKRIGQDTQFTNLDVVKAQTKAMQGLPPQYTAQLRAEVGAAITESVKNYALVMEADLETSSEAIRTFLQTTNKDISTKEKAVAEATRATNLLVKMAKLGGMNDEDVQQYMKFGAATGTAAGLSDTTLAALGAIGRRGGLRGDELGVFVRSVSSKLVAPTSKGMDALTAAGIDYNKFTSMPGGLSVPTMEAFMKRRFGKGFSADQKERLTDLLEDSETVGRRDDFIQRVSAIVGEGFKGKGGKTRAQDAQKIAKAVGDFYRLSVESVDAEGLLDEIMKNPKMTIALLNAMFTDKHGGKGSILASKWNEFGANKKELSGVAGDPEFAKRKADEIMGGLGGSFERLKGAVENLTLSIGEANAKWLKPTMDAIGNTMDKVSNAPAGVLQAGTIAAGTAGLLGAGTAAGKTAEMFGVIAPGATAAALSRLAAVSPWVAAAAAPFVLRSATADDHGTTSGERLNKYRGGTMNDVYRRAFNADRQRLGIDLIRGGGDVWSSGADPVAHLDVSSQAASAGQRTGEAYRDAVNEALQGVDRLIDAAVQRWIGKLGFSVSPSITPKVTEPPAQKSGSLEGISAKQHAMFADYGFNTA